VTFLFLDFYYYSLLDESARNEEATIMQQTASTGIIMFSCSEFSPLSNRVAIAQPNVRPFP